MLRIRTSTLTAVLLALLCALGAAASASASRAQLTYFEAPSDLLVPATRAHALAQLQHLGVRALRVELAWGSVTPGRTSATRPAFAATNPSSYSWGQYDAVISEAQRLHWQVLLTITSPAPRWATSDHRAPYVTRPAAGAFQEFMTAVGRHYGSQVSTFAIWNEPNHPAFLRPQWKSNGTPASPRIYRGLYQAGYAGLLAAGIAQPKVLFGETAPTGYTTINVRTEGALKDVAPLAFLRSALCLDSRYRRSSSCGRLQIAGYAHHAYTKAVSPYYTPPEGDNVSIGVLSRLAVALDRAARAGAITARVPIFLTEFGVQSVPNKQLGLPVAQQAEYDAISERIAWANSRVAAFSQYLLKDDALGGAPGSSVHGGFVGFQTGLEYHNGRPKPLYYGWPLPLTVTRSGGGYSLWGLIRPSEGSTRLTVLVRLRGSKRFRTLANVTTDNLGYWTLRSSVRGQTWRVRWTSPSGARYLGPEIRAY